MKRVASLLLCVLMMILSTTFASASEYVSFSLSNCNTDVNRLFTVSMKATGNTKLSAAIFEFSYDSGMLQFKEADADNAKITCNDVGDTIKAVYLCTNGKELDGDIFTVKFKALKSGKCRIGFKVYDCVNSNAEFIEVDKCTAGEIIISGSDSADTDNNSSANKEKANNSNKKKSSVGKTETEDEATPSIVDFGILNSVEDINIRILFIGIAIGVSVVILAFVAYFTLKRLRNKKSSKQSCDNVNTEEISDF